MKSHEKFFYFSNNYYSGVLLREKEMRKFAKILNRHKREAQEFLLNNLDGLEIKDWTLAYPNDEQTSVTYYTPSSDYDKTRRIEVATRLVGPRYEEVVFIADSMDDAKQKFMEWWSSENEEAD